MDIGKEKRTIYVEPLEQPKPEVRPVEEPAKREPEREPVPA